jgi:hypothetical protein
MLILKRLVTAAVMMQLIVFGAMAQTTVPYPPTVTDVKAHQDAYGRSNIVSAGSQDSKPVRSSARTSRYTKLLKQETGTEGWKINSKVVTSLGFGLAAIIGLGLAALLGDDDDPAASSTTTTTSTQ